MISLPIEVLCDHIFPHLSVCELQAVDTAFTSSTQRPQLRKVWLSYHYRTPEDDNVPLDDIKWLCDAGIAIDGIASILDKKDAVLKFLLAKVPTLRELHLIINDIKCYRNMPQSSPLCSNLEVLHFSAVVPSSAYLVPPSLRSPMIETMSSFAAKCVHLHTLILDRCSMNDAVFCTVCANCPLLMHIGISGGMCLTDASLHVIASTFPHLRSIKIRECNTFTDDGLLSIANACHELRCVAISDHFFSRNCRQSLWTANPLLTNIEFDYLSVEDVMVLVQCCRAIQVVTIRTHSVIDDEAIIALAENCPHLTALTIVCDFSRISDASLIAIGQHCHNLKSINISRIKGISDAGVEALVSGCPLLQEFSASDTPISDDGVVAIANNCHDLRKLYMDCCKVGIRGVHAIAESCPLISALSLFYSSVNNACLQAIAAHCRNLKFLQLYNSNKGEYDISVTTIHDVVASCRQLYSLTVPCDPWVSNAMALPLLRRSFPRLKYFSYDNF